MRPRTPFVGRSVQLLQMMANSKRLEILALLLKQEYHVNALAEAVGLSQSALSQHLAKFRQSDVVTTRRVGQTIYYSSSNREVKMLLETLAALHGPELLKNTG